MKNFDYTDLFELAMSISLLSLAIFVLAASAALVYRVFF